MMQCQCVVTLLLLANFLQAKEIEANVQLTATSIRLSETTTATLTIVGPSPLLVRVPNEPLSEESRAIWRATTVGTVSTTKLHDGQERWELPYRVEPFVPGDAIEFQFQPVEVNRRSIDIPPLIMIVTTDAKPAIANLRPWTDIERAPPSIASEKGVWFWLLMLLALPIYCWPFTLLMLITISMLVLWRRDKPLSVVSVLKQRVNSLQQEVEAIPADQFADQLYGIVRDYVTSHVNLTVGHLTMPELIQSIVAEDCFTLETRSLLQEVLQQCEALRFAPAPASDNRLSLLESVKLILHSQTVSPVSIP